MAARGNRASHRGQARARPRWPPHLQLWPKLSGPRRCHRDLRARIAAARRPDRGSEQDAVAKRDPRWIARRVGQIGRATSELQSLMRISYAVFCLKQKTKNNTCTDRVDT